MDCVKKNTAKKENTRKILRPRANNNIERAVKNVTHLLKKKQAQVKAAKKKRTNLIKRKSKVKARKLRQKKGIVYVGHIPHGFYEEQMKDYFTQFGKVTQVRVVRSKRTGRSRGYGYVEFLHPQVAEIAAESMNNYLMCGRLLKATYIPAEKQHYGFFMGADWSKDTYPKLQNRRKTILCKNRVESPEDYKNYIKKSMGKLFTLEDKLKDKGISISFRPVDVPSEKVMDS